MSRGAFIACAPITSLSFAASRMSAQDLTPRATAPINVTIDAKVIPLGASVTLHGKTVAKNAAKPVTIVVTRSKADAAGAAPPAAHLTAPYQTDGSFP